jgi:RNA polymerase sigma factor (sigma-70 family)
MTVPPSEDAEYAELVAGIAAGQASSETEMYTRFNARVFYLAMRELRSRDRAEDVRSETMLRVLVAVREGRLRSAAALPAFVLQTARNVMRETWRAAGRTVAFEDANVPEPSVETNHGDEGERRALERAIEGLGERDRAVLRLHYYEDLSRDEIAARLGIIPERVRLVRSRALQRVRAALAEVTRR